MQKQYLNALIIVLLLPGLSWVGMFMGGRTYFFGSLSCVLIFYAFWVFILNSKKANLFLTPSGGVFYRPLILRYISTPVLETLGGFVIVPTLALPIILSFDNPDTNKDGLASFIIGFWLTFAMGLWIQLIYFLYAFLLRKHNK